MPTGVPTRRQFVRARVKLAKVADVRNATALAGRTGDPALYVAVRTGQVVAVTDGPGGSSRRLLDISGDVSTEGQGLLGLAFSRRGDRLFVSYTDRQGASRVDAYTVADGRVRWDSRQRLLRVEQPSPRHNGGHVAVDREGLLWLALGDGGLTEDPTDNGQSLDTLLGKLLRVDPRPAGRRAYRIPKDNPFVGRPAGRPEIFAYGLRNPWRFAIDRATGDVWIGDVGQFVVEEIDLLPPRRAGANFGWNRMCPGSFPSARTPTVSCTRCRSGMACSASTHADHRSGG